MRFLPLFLLMACNAAPDFSDDTDEDTLPPSCPVNDDEGEPIPFFHYCMAWCPSAPDVQDCVKGYEAGESGRNAGRLDCINGLDANPDRYVGEVPDDWSEARYDGFLQSYLDAYAKGYAAEGCDGH